MGGMAEVYRAKASGAGGFEKQLAIKRILPNYSQNEEFRRMFEYEARLSSMLTHANIVQVYDFVKSSDTYLLAMEYVDGKNLRQFLNKAKKINFPLPIEFGVYVINEVCKGLEYAHKKRDDLTGRPLNIIHRDMSPQNVMLAYEGAAKIVDFGIAKAKDRVDETRSGVIKGKFGYMSPEQANGEPVDHRTDIFSTSIILFELLTNRRLFVSDNDMATLKMIQECVIPQPSKINPKIQPELEKIILKGLTKDLTLRFQSAGNFHRNLQEFLNKYYTSYTQKDVSDVLMKVFKEEIESEKKRFEQIYRQSIPFSQGAPEEQEEEEDDNNGAQLDLSDEEGLEKEGTKSENEGQTAVTYVGEEGSLEDPPAAPRSVAKEGDEKSHTTNAVESTHIDNGLLDHTSSSTLGRNLTSRASLSRPVDTQDHSQQGTPTNANTKNETPTNVTGVTSASVSYTPTIEKSIRADPTQATGKPRVALRSLSGLTLQTSTNTVIPENRRRSAGPVNSKTSSELSIAPSRAPSAPVEKLRVEVPPPQRPEEQDFYEERPGLWPKVKTFFSAVALMGLVFTVFYLYQIYLRGGVPRVIEKIVSLVSGKDEREPRFPSAEPKAAENAAPDPTAPEEDVASQTVPVNPPPITGCTLEIGSDPPGATVLVNDQEHGITPATVSVECQVALNLTLKKEGYEIISENRQLKLNSENVYKVLKKIPEGKLDLTLSQNAEVTIPDVKFSRSVRAGEKISVALRAKRRVRVFFKNKVLGIDTFRDFIVEENESIRQTVRLEESISRPPPPPPLPQRRR
jgi:serine/threonine protein kinase